MSNLRTHAERELKILGYNLEDQTETPNKWMADNVLQLLEIFGKQGHSGFSAAHLVRLFTKLAMFEPLAPLSGNDDEWNEVADGVQQNNRCSHVFKEEGGEAYDINGKIFREPDGACFTNKDSRVPVVFPYTQQSVFVDVPKQAELEPELPLREDAQEEPPSVIPTDSGEVASMGLKMVKDSPEDSPETGPKTN